MVLGGLGVLAAGYFAWRVAARLFREGLGRERAQACTPSEALGLLALDVGGIVTRSSSTVLLEGRFRDRALSISVRGRGALRYLIRLETGTLKGSLSGADALERLAATANGTAAPGLAEVADLVAGMRDWRALYRVFSAHDIHFDEGHIVASADFGGAILGATDEAERVRRLLERLVLVSGVVPALFTLRPRLESAERCPYCHDAIEESEHETAYYQCRVRHHSECWNEHGKCAVFGCGPAIAVRVRARLEALPGAS